MSKKRPPAPPPPPGGEKPTPPTGASPEPPRGLAERRAQARRVLRRLAADHPDAYCELVHQTPEQLLVATILSAQCTDRRVNLVTSKLFADCPTPAALASLTQARLERYIASTGFFRNKAKNIRACCTELVSRHGGLVPRDLDELVKLPGVGRKTANVVLGVSFGMATGVVVDTHVGRLSRRLGLTDEIDPVKVERDLVAVLPRSSWVDFSHRMIFHGRRVCSARSPRCGECSMAKFCPRQGVAA